MVAFARTRRIATSVFILLLSAAICVPCSHAAAEDLANVEIAFSPRDDVRSMIVERIGRAKESVQMQAYLLTDRRVAHALVAARKRGVEVEVIGDAIQHGTGGLPHAKALDRAGVRVFLNESFVSAHDKIIIVDGGSDAGFVITGSYNFTSSAQERNAENVVVLSGNRAVTGRYLANFEFHRDRSRRWP
jgi:phosphatidylserine/phosphatidylglycerophosphate/cardiolipin synthase-like enzyme